MINESVIRLMEAKDLFEVPEARKKFEKHSTHGDYFFFVIHDETETIVGYLIAQREGNKVLVKELEVNDTVQDKRRYRNVALSNLYDYVKNIRGTDGKRICYQVSV